MTDIYLLSYSLLPLFFAIAFIHSCSGLAGGSSYTALMAISGVPIQVIPSISLSLNTLVSSLGAFNFIRSHHFKFSLWWPFQLGAVPAVYIGAGVVLPALFFYILLLLTLLFSLLKLLGFAPDYHKQWEWNPLSRCLISLVIGAILGFLSGSIGIGGGIYLIPCILLLGLGSIKEAGSVAIVFILINSVIGLMTKWQMGLVNIDMILPVLITVGLGGGLGSLFGARYFSEKTMKTALIVVLSIASLLLVQKIILLF